MPKFRTEIIGDCTLILGDCLEVMPTLDKVDLVLADPPYGTTKNKWDKIIPFEDMWQAISYVSRVDTPTVLTAQTPFDKSLGMSNIENLKYEWIWEKTAATGFLNSNNAPIKAHENVLVFYDKPPKYNPQKTKGHERKTSRRKGVKSRCYNNSDKSTSYDSTERYPRSVITFSSDKQTANYHSTQKPVELMAYFIRTYTDEGDTVIDFAMGSGTTGAACAKLGRKFIGIEKEKEEGFFDIACRRIEEAYKQPDLFIDAPKEPTQQELNVYKEGDK